MAKWIHCKKCGHKYMNSVPRCPQCFAHTPLSARRLLTVLPLGVLIAAAIVLPIVALTTGSGETPKEDPTTQAAATTTTTTVSDPTVNTAESHTGSSTTGTTVVATNKYRQPTDTDGNVVIGSDGIAKITMPKWLLLLTEPDFNYQLTEKEKKDYRFTGIAKNADGSATYTIDQNDFHRCRLVFTSNANGLVSGLEKLSTVTDVEFTYAQYGKIKVYTAHSDATQLQADTTLAQSIVAAGLQVTVVQYFDIDQSIGSTFEIYGANGTLLATTKFPTVLQN